MTEVLTSEPLKVGLPVSNNLVETPNVSVGWYEEHPGARLTPERRSFMIKYTGIADEDLETHLLSNHKRAWDLRPYPCIGTWNFIRSFMSLLPAYHRVMHRLKIGSTILDVGCCLGQDLRELVAEGCPSSRMFACDIVHGFWDIGFSLFRDRETFKATFMQADLFDTLSPLKGLWGNMDNIYLGCVLHLFGWAQQVEALIALMPLTHLGTLMFGCGVGWTRGIEVETKWKNGTKSMYYHDDESMRRLWKEVGEATGTVWEVEPQTLSMEAFFPVRGDWDWLGEDARMSTFQAFRMK